MKFQKIFPFKERNPEKPLIFSNDQLIILFSCFSGEYPETFLLLYSYYFENWAQERNLHQCAWLTLLNLEPPLVKHKKAYKIHVSQKYVESDHILPRASSVQLFSFTAMK